MDPGNIDLYGGRPGTRLCGQPQPLVVDGHVDSLAAVMDLEAGSVEFFG